MCASMYILCVSCLTESRNHRDSKPRPARKEHRLSPSASMVFDSAAHVIGAGLLVGGYIPLPLTLRHTRICLSLALRI